MLVDADYADAVEPSLVVDQPPLAFGEDRTVRGMPGDSESGRDAGHCEVIDDDPG